jgi:hypothetical protein
VLSCVTRVDDRCRGRGGIAPAIEIQPARAALRLVDRMTEKTGQVLVRTRPHPDARKDSSQLWGRDGTKWTLGPPMGAVVNKTLNTIALRSRLMF